MRPAFQINSQETSPTPSSVDLLYFRCPDQATVCIRQIQPIGIPLAAHAQGVKQSIRRR